MTKKRFTIEEWDIWDYADSVLVIFQNGEFISNKDVVDLLNEQHEAIQSLKKDNKILMDKLFEMRTNDAFDRTEISRQHYTVDEFLEELEKW